MIHSFNGVLKIDPNRGVIYFHSDNGTTLLRICSLPTPIPTNSETLLDITHNVGVSWQGKIRADNTMPGTPENYDGLLKLLDGWKCCSAPNMCNATCQRHFKWCEYHPDQNANSIEMGEISQ